MTGGSESPVGAGISMPYLRATATSFSISGGPSGGDDGSVTGSPTSSKNSSSPADVMITTILLGVDPTLRKLCTIPLGPYTTDPAAAEMVRPLTTNSSSPSST